MIQEQAKTHSSKQLHTSTRLRVNKFSDLTYDLSAAARRGFRWLD